ncbi:PH domain-containing protein [Effusibacillus lacus]|uniref:PH domain-containing protein n=1 Tax=Effusibacillus lacus TaxID=1348429 RepID=UPI000BB98627|nr:PH domain-containing protein [Effusibacillus lacus]
MEEVQKDFAHVLASTEKIQKAYKLIRDMFIVTNKREYVREGKLIFAPSMLNYRHTGL